MCICVRRRYKIVYMYLVHNTSHHTHAIQDRHVDNHRDCPIVHLLSAVWPKVRAFRQVDVTRTQTGTKIRKSMERGEKVGREGWRGGEGREGEGRENRESAMCIHNHA